MIKLGHHGRHLHAGEAVEPAVSIIRVTGLEEYAAVYWPADFHDWEDSC